MLTVLLVALAASGGGSGGCPCIEWSGLENHLIKVDNTPVLAYKPDGGKGPTYHYDANYGSVMCKAWDAGLEPYCNSRFPAAWCLEKWCYVDTANCDKTNARSGLFPNDNVYYSYLTCGQTNSFSAGSMDTGDNLGSLIGIVEGYSRQARQAAEAAPADETCAAADTCGCDVCEYRASWGLGVSNRHTAGIAGSDNSGTCVAEALSAAYLRVGTKENDDPDRVGYQYGGLQANGFFMQWPAIEWCPDSYDPRFRPWYAGAATGPKDIVLVVDDSGSMSSPPSRIRNTVAATLLVIDTLQDFDYVGVVLFNPVLTYADLLVPATAENKDRLKVWVKKYLDASGGTNFAKPIDAAFKMLRDSAQDGKTSTCNRAMLFLTDGAAPDPNFASIAVQAEEYGVTIFAYALGSGANTRVTERLACENRGIFYQVDDTADLEAVMVDYFQYFGLGVDSCTVRWSLYNDAATGEELLAGCLPFYEAGGALGGVTCTDINLIVDVPTLKAHPKWEEFQCQYESVSKECAAIYLNACKLKELRDNAGSIPGVTSSDCSNFGGGTCSAQDAAKCVDVTCVDDRDFKDKDGYACHGWVGDDCTRIAELWNSYGYTDADQQAILDNCPYSCKTCGWTSTCPARDCTGITGHRPCGSGSDSDDSVAFVAAFAALLWL